MPYVIPDMPLTCSVFEMIDTDFNNKVFRASSACQLLAARRGSYNPYTDNNNDTIGGFPVTLLLPKGANVLSSVQTFVGYCDILQIDQLPGFWFYVADTYPVGFGYDNEYLVAIIVVMGRYIWDNAPPPPGRWIYTP